MGLLGWGYGTGLVAWGSAVPKILKARPPHDDGEERKIRKLAGARHAPADWTERARIITLSWDALGVPPISPAPGWSPGGHPVRAVPQQQQLPAVSAAGAGREPARHDLRDHR